LSSTLDRLLNSLEVGIVIVLIFISEAILISFSENNYKTVTNITTYILIFIVVGLFFRKPRSTGLGYIMTRDKVLLFLIGLALVSIVWSTSPVTTWDYGKTLLRSLLFGAYLTARFSVRDQMYMMATALAIAALLSLLTCVIPPNPGIHYINDQYAWRGIYGHKQYLARAMTVATLSFILVGVLKPRLRLLLWVGTLLPIYLVVQSTGRTAMVTLVFCLSLIPLYGLLKQDYRVRTATLIVTGLTVAIGGIFLAANFETFIVDILGKSLDFNGRTPLWTSVLEKGLERPWLGYGYYGFWSTPEAYSVINEPWTLRALQRGTLHAHSIFVDLFLQLGIVGLVAFVLSYITLIYRLIRLLILSPKIEYFWMLQITVLGLISQSTEVPVTLSFNVFLWIFYISICNSSVLELERFKRAQAVPIDRTPSTKIVRVR
jgi:exopolysaccharide production protein ExoQ